VYLFVYPMSLFVFLVCLFVYSMSFERALHTIHMIHKSLTIYKSPRCSFERDTHEPKRALYTMHKSPQCSFERALHTIHIIHESLTIYKSPKCSFKRDTHEPKRALYTTYKGPRCTFERDLYTIHKSLFICTPHTRA